LPGVPQRLCRYRRLGYARDTVLIGDSTGDDTLRIAPETSLTPSMTMAEFLAQSLEGEVSALVTMLTCPYPLIEAFLAHRAKTGFLPQTLIN